MNIKNLKINKTTVIAILTTSTMFLTTGCGVIDTSELSFNDVIDNPIVQEITVLDEEKENNDFIKQDIEDVKKLETAIEIVNLNKKDTFDEVESLIPLTEEEKEETLSLDIDGIKKLKDMSTNSDTDLLSLENRLIAVKKIAYLDKYYKEFLNKEGLSVAEDILKYSIKGSIAAERGISTDLVKIGNMPSKDLDFLTITMDGEDYKVKTSNKDMWNAIEYVYSIEFCDRENMSDEEIKNTCIKALDYAKAVTLKGSNIKDDKIVEQYSNGYVKKNILK